MATIRSGCAPCGAPARMEAHPGAGLFGPVNFPAARHRDRTRDRPAARRMAAGARPSGPPPGPAVATERCMWRNRVLKGECMTRIARRWAGRPAMPALFGTVAGVLDFAQGVLTGSFSPMMLRSDPHPAIFAPHLRLGAQVRRLVGRPGLFGRDDRAHGLHRHRAVDRLRARHRLDPAHQPRPPDAPFRQRHLRAAPRDGDAVINAWEAP